MFYTLPVLRTNLLTAALAVLDGCWPYTYFIPYSYAMLCKIHCKGV